jgi:eukaryotic-like serine/threonine-protein kinase
MITIRLEKAAWKYDPKKLLGPAGGFGAVFAGQSSAGDPVAVKRLHVSAADAGHRELRVAEFLLGGEALRHVIPILDAGCDADSEGYFIVMGRADKSLQDLIKSEPVQEVEAIRILDEIAAGFTEIPEIIHRDLKPGNVLFFDGRWVLADLGIARFVADSTSLRTLGDCLSPQYAAPEQWKGETASRATDVYAFGGIVHALVRGRPPFEGSSREVLQQQHLEAKPPTLECSAPLRLLASMCLRKSPEARPPWDSVRKQLANLKPAAPVPHHGLAAAAARLAQEEAHRESEANKIAQAEERRVRLARDAFEILDDVVSVLFDEVGRAAPNAERGPDFIGLNGAVLSLAKPFGVFQADMLAEVGWDIVAGAVLLLKQPVSPHEGRSSNLFYVRLPGKERHRWIEICFRSVMGRARGRFEPFGVGYGGMRDVLLAVSKVVHTVDIHAGPVEIDEDGVPDFIARWLKRFAEAVDGQLPDPPIYRD